MGDVKIASLNQEDDLREAILQTASHKLDHMKSLSGASHHGGTRMDQSQLGLRICLKSKLVK